MGRKRFIDKNKCVHFALVHNHENNGEDDNAPTRMLQPFMPMAMRRKGHELSDAAYDFADLINHDGAKSTKIVDEDLNGDCYFPKDGYDYGQHLRAVEQLGYEVKLTEEEEDALNYAVPHNKVEEETLEALADADMYDEADDDFFDGILAGGAAEDEELMLWGEEHNPMQQLGDNPFVVPEDLDLDEFLGNANSDDENDICTLPVRANKDVDDELLNILEQYDDDQIGELDEDEAMGQFGLDTYEEALEEYRKNRRTFGESIDLARKQETLDAGKDARDLHAHLGLDRSDDEMSSEEEYEVRTVSAQETWDVESMASLRSNLSNHPGKINRIKNAKPKKEKKINLEPIGEDNTIELPDVDYFRPDDETKEEKKARKSAVKEQRRICREMKKQNKQVWKKEADKLKARSAMHGSDVRLGVRVVPI